MGKLNKCIDVLCQAFLISSGCGALKYCLFKSKGLWSVLRPRQYYYYAFLSHHLIFNNEQEEQVI